LEIKDKKGIENHVANHLSRMYFKEPQELPISDSLRDDMLFKVTKTDPWYANIVNFMVAGYVPPGENKKRLIYESRLHIWDPPYLFRVCSDGLLSIFNTQKSSPSMQESRRPLLTVSTASILVFNTLQRLYIFTHES